MGILFLLTGIFMIWFGMAYESGEFKNTFAKWVYLGSGGALLIGWYKGEADMSGYLFFIAFPILIFIYTFYKHKDTL